MTKHSLTLNTGALIPIIGLGTWKSPKDKAGQAVEHALLECNYRHVDCASIYGNEKEVGVAFENVFGQRKVPREEVFVTGKLWNSDHERTTVITACKKTLADLQLDYLDLYLMHWGIAIPAPDEPLDENGVLITEKISVRETWEAMEELVHTGLVRAIGVANFTAPMIADLLTYAHIPPAVNQIELHPYLQQTKLVAFCQYRNIVVTAYSPLGSPGNYADTSHLLQNETITQLARTHRKTPAQILIRWGIQRGTIVIPKSVTPMRIKENIDVFDFELSEKEMQAIVYLDKNLRFVEPYDWWKIPYFS